MGGFGSIWHWMIVALVVLVVFGRGRISETMGDFGKGIRSFKKGLSEEDTPRQPAAPPPPPQQIAAPPPVSEPAPAPAPSTDGSTSE
jgi:sec-independent protein translocase protein TatA